MPEATREYSAAPPSGTGTPLQAPGEVLPRIALFLFDAGDAQSVRKFLERIPESVIPWIEEVVVMEGPIPVAGIDDLSPGAPIPLRVHRNPRDYGHGGERKAAFEYALLRDLHHVITLRGDGTHPPEALPDLIRAAVIEGHDLVLASRLMQRRQSLRDGMPIHRVLGHTVATGFQNRILGLRTRDHLTSYRAYNVETLRRIPFQNNSNDRTFDVEFMIQCRALGVTVFEVGVSPAWREDLDGRSELRHIGSACATAMGYRFHQLHLTRDGRYLVDRDIHYTLKHSRTGSHMQIVDAIAPGSRVLDLGCSQGLLAEPLGEKGARVTGVDTAPPRGISKHLEQYFQRDLEDPLDLPTGRVFDCVVCADVIEHLRNREQLLRSARRYLTEGGRLVISTPNIALWFYRLSLAVGRFEYGPRGVLDWTHVHLFTRATFRREVERAGFHIVDERATALPFEVVFESTGRSRLVRALGNVYHALARAWPEMFAYQIILLAEITTLDEEATAGPQAGASEAAPRRAESDAPNGDHPG
jgi:2-polyprenyl-3-methyl-5-hydroxy-6-metoxy-1,4-benzoquinol methylase